VNWAADMGAVYVEMEAVLDAITPALRSHRVANRWDYRPYLIFRSVRVIRDESLRALWQRTYDLSLSRGSTSKSCLIVRHLKRKFQLAGRRSEVDQPEPRNLCIRSREEERPGCRQGLRVVKSSCILHRVLCLADVRHC
jgi:hypothetical protein